MKDESRSTQGHWWRPWLQYLAMLTLVLSVLGGAMWALKLDSAGSPTDPGSAGSPSTVVPVSGAAGAAPEASPARALESRRARTDAEQKAVLSDVAPSQNQHPIDEGSGLPLVAPSQRMPPIRSAPWPARGRFGVLVQQHPGEPILPGMLDAVRMKALGLRKGPHRLISKARWPREPDAPPVVDPIRFHAAVTELCPHGTAADLLGALSSGALSAAEAFRVEPFALVALAYQQSRCGLAPPDSWGLGVTRINIGMHRSHIRDGHYHYGVWRAGDGFVRKRLPMLRYPFDRKQLARVRPNLYFAAAFLRAFGEQCPDIDGAFRSAPHRSPLSHVIWGDAVRTALSEDLVFTARRRLLGYYAPQGPTQRAHYRGLSLVSPLDGGPRVVIGVMGDPRESGQRRHAGIDFLSTLGEPVRAMAGGTVTFAGVDSRKRGFLSLTPDQAEQASRDRMGPRGLFVQVVHGDQISTLYVHLSEYLVRTGEIVRSGQVLGYVGRTGIHSSDAHLHLGLFDHGVPVDPLPHLQPLLITADDMASPGEAGVLGSSQSAGTPGHLARGAAGGNERVLSPPAPPAAVVLPVPQSWPPSQEPISKTPMASTGPGTPNSSL